MKMKGFTLIELLIVVAIIAILAAIAVPNFLEAQTRSKVARTQADMRTMATAAESYRVDYNRYPLPVAILNGSLTVVYPNPSPNNSLYVHNFLPQTVTTPISYISSIPTDVFVDQGLEPSPERSYMFYNSFEYTKILAGIAGVTLSPPAALRANAYGAWVMFSNGPDQDNKDLGGSKVGLTLINGVYDPSNGTVSNGDIIRTQRNPSGFSL
jgi:type II secretion system protein G